MTTDPDYRTLAHEFSALTWQRGKHYAHAGRVVNLVPSAEEPTGWEAIVRGSRAQRHEVWLDIFTDDGVAGFDGGCTCRAVFPCKHIAAVISVLHANSRDARVDAQLAETHRVKSELSALRRWSEDLAATTTPKPSAPVQSRKTKRILFLVDVTAGQVCIAPRTSNLRKNNTFGATRHYDLGQALSSYRAAAEFVTATDQLLWFRLTQLNVGRLSSPYMPRLAATADGAQLFAEFVATGRCYWQPTAGRPLVPGGLREAALVWRTDAEGNQSVALDLLPQPDEHLDPTDPGPLLTPSAHQSPGEGVTILPLLPLHYIDHRTGHTGPVTVPGVRDEVAHGFASIPRLDAETVAQLPAAVVQALTDHGLPQPVVRPVRKPTPVEPTPRLSLLVDESAPAGADGFTNAYGKVEFEYGSVRLAPATRTGPAVVRSVLGGEVVKTIVDRHAEHRRIEELLAQGPNLEPRPDGDVIFELDADGWTRFYENGTPTLRSLGWTVDVDPAFPFHTLTAGDWYLDVEAGEDDWFGVEVGVEIDGERVNILPVVVAAIRSGQLVRERLRAPDDVHRLALGDGRWVAVPRERLVQILDALVELFDERLVDGRLKLARGDAGRLLALDGMTWDGDRKLRALAEQLARQAPLPRVTPPRTLKAQLRDYQRLGLDWLAFLRTHGFGGVLADDMGLGKTIQAIAHILVEKRKRRLTRPCLIVAPRSVLENWARECDRFAPSLRHAIYHGPGRNALLDADHPDVMITTYALLQRDEALRKISWHLVILDEAQVIKNPRTRVAEAARSLQAQQRLCLTGTPMENNLQELWSLFAFVAPGLLGGLSGFNQRYRRPIERDGDAGRMAALSARIAPFLLRRTKAQVLTELPPKTEVLVHVPLGPRQRDLYESVRLTMEKRVRTAMAARGLAKSHIIVLDALLKLRQVCCHPALVKTRKRKDDATASAKTARLMELLGELCAEGRRSIVFSQFTSMLEIVRRELDALGLAHQSITGRTRNRQAVVDAYQAGEFPILLISLKAGGTGLNLTSADTVIHYDPWWNPAVEDQATDRAHRIGQQQPVTVYRLVCDGTVEQTILAMQARKRAITGALQRDAEQRSATGLRLAPDDIDRLLGAAVARPD